MRGVRLKELPASDMVDIIHYLFEEDMATDSAEAAEAKSKLRENLYSTMYGSTYKYPYKAKNKNNEFIDPDSIPFEDADPLADVKPFDPLKEPTKPFTPATEFDPEAANPFSGTLDAPMR